MKFSDIAKAFNIWAERKSQYRCSPEDGEYVGTAFLKDMRKIYNFKDDLALSDTDPTMSDSLRNTILTYLSHNINKYLNYTGSSYQVAARDIMELAEQLYKIDDDGLHGILEI